MKSRQHERRNVSAFSGLLEAPESAETPFVLPANGRFAMRPLEDLSEPQVALTVIGATEYEIEIEAHERGTVEVIDFLEKDVSVELAEGIQLMIDTGLGDYRRIAGDVYGAFSRGFSAGFLGGATPA